MLQTVRTFFTYAAIGIVNTAVSLLLYFLLIALHITPTIALAVSYFAGMGTSYFLNARFTFNQNAYSAALVLRFLTVNVVLLLMSEWSLHEIMHVLTRSAYLAQIVNVIPMTLIGYLANRQFVFTARHDDRENRIYAGFFGCAVGIALIQRIWVTLGGYLFSATHHVKTLKWLLIQGLIHWDAGWFLSIARHGYVHVTQLAFFPFYPVIIRVFHDATTLPDTVSGVIVSSVSFVVAMYYLGRIAHRLFSTRVAILAMLFFAFFPTSYYFDAPYSEALFMALSLAAVENAYRRNFFLASFLTALATLTRNTGALLLLLVFWQYLSWRGMDFRFYTRAWWKKLDYRVMSLTLPIVFLLSYAVWLHQHYGHYLAFLTAEKHWHRQYMPLWDTYAHTLRQYITGLHPILASYYLLLELISALLSIVFIALSIWSYRVHRAQGDWILYLVILTWIASTEPSVNIPDYLVSLPRYLLMLFPGFILLAERFPRIAVAIPLLLVSAIFLLRLSGLYYSGSWIA
ncbi:GtrA family protein [Ferroacidibacillus organovorans]|uniref:GtrA/DPMS transmembrane domain-containing protein n=1 Tax=Ferroacidibacillus organovorans TaxID=1765683 RepID=A0A853KCX3_9BACL|nr:GtrA family protein [Ferroacidibacillus organovorans]KYP80499.1 hypothetical protein AYJ22_02330 [Ferroacidibacillus organovorans]OAG94727.1 hypothetical protein AYW79_04095 [Ferroacidibacillus organovorans]